MKSRTTKYSGITGQDRESRTQRGSAAAEALLKSMIERGAGMSGSTDRADREALRLSPDVGPRRSQRRR